MEAVYKVSIAKMKEGDWQAALDELTTFVEGKENAAALDRFGPKYGWFWYHKGYCEARLDLHEKAAGSFATCYTDFPNSPDAKNKNTFHTYSLYKSAVSYFELKDYKKAKEYFEKFIAEKKPGDRQSSKFSRPLYYVSLSVCNFNLGLLDEGLETLKTALDNQDTFLTPLSSAYSGFDALLALAIEQKNEQVILEFINEYRAFLTSDVSVASQFAKRSLSRASAAINAGMAFVPAELISLVPDAKASMNDLQAQLDSLEGVKLNKPLRDGYYLVSTDLIGRLQERLQDDADSDQSNEALSLALSAFLWSKANNHRAAYAAYSLLEEKHKHSKGRESNLFNLIRVCQNLGKTDEAEKYGQEYLKMFPGNEKQDDVKKILLSGLYFSKKYDQCIELAKKQLPILSADKPSTAHDLCSYALAGSYFYTGQFAQADEVIKAHLEDYKKGESKFELDMRYLEASNKTRLGQWKQAKEKLTQFLEDYKDERSPLYPFAMFDLVNSHYALQEYAEASKRIVSIEKRYPDSPVVMSAYNLNGNILEGEQKYAEAEGYYLKALDAAKKRNNNSVASEALYYEILLLTSGSLDGDRTADAVKYYDEFWASYAEGSPFQVQVAVAGLPALKEVGRADDGLNRMKTVIATVAGMNGKPMLEEIVNSYRDFYLEVKSIDELKSEFANFPGISANDQEALSLFKIALIGGYEKAIKAATKASEDKKVLKLTANLKLLFSELKTEFKPSVLSNNALAKIGDYLRLKTSTPREALAYYQELAGRKEAGIEHKAKFGLADIYAVSTQAAEKSKAVKFLKELYADESGKKSDKEKALYRLIEMYYQDQNWKLLNENTLEYINNKKLSKNKPMVTYYYAVSFDKQGDIDSAFTAYTKAYATNISNLKIAAPSMKRQMEILWDRNTPQTVENEKVTMSSRQAAYNQGWKYINATKKHLDKMTPEDKSIWKQTEALVLQYEQSKEVIDMATQKKK